MVAVGFVVFVMNALNFELREAVVDDLASEEVDAPSEPLLYLR